MKREEKNIFQQKTFFSNFKNSSNFESGPALGRLTFDQICHKVGRPWAESGPAHSQNMLNLKKRKSENLAKRKQEIQILINTNF